SIRAKISACHTCSFVTAPHGASSRHSRGVGDQCLQGLRSCHRSRGLTYKLASKLITSRYQSKRPPAFRRWPFGSVLTQMSVRLGLQPTLGLAALGFVLLGTGTWNGRSARRRR